MRLFYRAVIVSCRRKKARNVEKKKERKGPMLHLKSFVSSKKSTEVSSARPIDWRDSHLSECSRTTTVSHNHSSLQRGRSWNIDNTYLPCWLNRNPWLPLLVSTWRNKCMLIHFSFPAISPSQLRIRVESWSSDERSWDLFSRKTHTSTNRSSEENQGLLCLQALSSSVKYLKRGTVADWAARGWRYQIKDVETATVRCQYQRGRVWWIAESPSRICTTHARRCSTESGRETPIVPNRITCIAEIPKINNFCFIESVLFSFLLSKSEANQRSLWRCITPNLDKENEQPELIEKNEQSSLLLRVGQCSCLRYLAYIRTLSKKPTECFYFHEIETSTGRKIIE